MSTLKVLDERAWPTEGLGIDSILVLLYNESSTIDMYTYKQVRFFLNWKQYIDPYNLDARTNIIVYCCYDKQGTQSTAAILTNYVYV